MKPDAMRGLEIAGAIPTGDRHFKGVNAGARSSRALRPIENARNRKFAKRVTVKINVALRSIANRKGARLCDYPKPVGRSPVLGDLLDWLGVEPYIDETGRTCFRDKS